jgi:hypothetical protein
MTRSRRDRVPRDCPPSWFQGAPARAQRRVHPLHQASDGQRQRSAPSECDSPLLSQSLSTALTHRAGPAASTSRTRSIAAKAREGAGDKGSVGRVAWRSGLGGGCDAASTLMGRRCRCWLRPATHFVIDPAPTTGRQEQPVQQDLLQALCRRQNKRASDRKSLTLLSFFWRARFELPTTKFVDFYGSTTPVCEKSH